METVIQFALLGLGVGAVYAIIAIGVVLVYRASGVLNFATGGICALSAFGFYELTSVMGVDPWVSLILVILGAAAVGALVQWLVMARLREASTLTRLIAALGVMTVLQGVVVLIWGSDQLFAPSIMPEGSVEIGAVSIQKDRLVLLAIAVVLTVVLSQVYLRTSFGRSTSAVAENRRAAAGLGISTNVVEIVNWSIGGALSGLAGILIAPIVGLNAGGLILVIIPSLAAALVGGFASFTLTVGGALVIGVLQSEVSNYVSPYVTGAAAALPVLVIVVVIVVGGRARPARGDLSSALPVVGPGRIPPVLTAVGVVVALGLIMSGIDGAASAVTVTLTAAILIISVVVVTGYAGQVSLGQWALAGMGAWIAARLVAGLGLPFWLAALAGIVGAVPVGLLIALPALRTRGVNLAVATLGLALVVQSMILGSGPLTGGVDGTDIGIPSLFGIALDATSHPELYAVFTLVCFVLVALVASNLRRGRAGRRLLAVRSNERAAASIGVGVYRAKLYAFALGSAIAAVAGILTAFQTQIVIFSQFDSFGSINAVLWCVVGGLAWVSGSIGGAMFAAGSVGAWILNGILGSVVDDWMLIIGGVAVIATVISAPDGLAAHYAGPVAALRARFARPRPPKAAARTGRRLPPRARGEFSGFEARDIEVRYGGVVALSDVTFRIGAGEILGLIGPNGAGKTTLLDVATGFHPPSKGDLSLGGVPIRQWSPERRARAGIGRSFQAVELFDDMTVRENLLAAAEPGDMRSYFTDLVAPGAPPTSDLLEEVVEEFELAGYLDSMPAALPQGARRLVGIARSIMTEPQVLFLDEPAAGLDEHESERLGHLIQRLARHRNIAVVLVEHDVPLVMRVCDRVTVLNFGRVIAHGPPAEIRVHPDVIAAYLGEEHAAAVPTGS